MAIKFLSGQTITGNITLSGDITAATFNSLAINSTGTNNVANQIVRTQANGYVNFGWINSVSGNHTGSITRITASNDAYLRYVTPAQFRTGVTDGYYASAGTVDGVTSVATGNGLSGGTITGTGTLTMSGSYTGSFTVTDDLLASEIQRKNKRGNTGKHSLGHYDRGEAVWELDPTMSTQEIADLFGQTTSAVYWTEVADAPGGWCLYLNGGVYVGGVYNSGFPYLPVETDSPTQADYYMECYIQNVGSNQTHYMGSNEFNESFSSLGGHPGSYGYWVMSNTNPGTSWTKVSGYIGGFSASTIGTFENGTKYWTPMALFNYGAGSGTRACRISGWKVYKVYQKGNRKLAGTLDINSNINSGFFSVFAKNTNAGSSAYVSKKWINDDAGFGEIWRNSTTRSGGGQAASSFNMYNSADINFWSGTTHTMALVGSNVGIGTGSTAPSNRLTVNQGGGVRVTGIANGSYIELSGDLPGYAVDQYPVIKSGGTIHFANNGKYSAFIEGSDTYFGMLNSSTQTKVQLHTNGNTYFLGGSIGIGTTTPIVTAWGSTDTRQLTIVGSNYGVITLQGSATALTKYSMGVGGNRFYMAYDNVAGRHNIVVNSSGYVGIGTDSPDNKLQVVAGNAQVQAWFGETGYTNASIRVGGDNAAGGRVFIQYVGDDSYIDSYGGHGSTQRYRDFTVGARNIRFVTGNTSGSEKMRITSDGNVGIAATPPTNGYTASGGGWKMLQIGQSSQIAAYGTDDEIGIFQNTYLNSSGVFQAITSNVAGSSIILVDGKIYFKTATTSGTAQTTSTSMFIDTTGNVGIGTDSPTFKLEVKATTTNTAVFTTSNTVTCNTYFGHTSISNNTNLILYSNGGNVQMWKSGNSSSGWGGTKAFNVYNSDGVIAFHPSGNDNKLVVQNSAQSLRIKGGSATGNNYMQFVNNAGTNQGYFGYGGSSNILYIVQQVAGDIVFYTNSAIRGSISQGGTLTMGGDVVAYGSPSDKRLKENIKPVKSALDKVSKLQGVTFDWKDKKQEYDQYGKPHKLQEWKEDIGFIAQDVKKVVPELVRENEDGMLSMRHQGIAPILLEAIKEQQKQIEDLQAQIKNISNTN